MTDLSALGSAASGVWTRAEALQHLSPGQVDALVRRGTWQVLWCGVYADGGYLLDAEQRAHAAVLAAGGAQQLQHAGAEGRPRLTAVACGRTAARVWSLPLIDDDDPAAGRSEHQLDDVAVARRLPVQAHAGRRLTPRRGALTRRDVVRRPSGLWVTGPVRTLADCAHLLRPDALTCAVDGALHAGLVDEVGLTAAARAGAARPGAPALREAVRTADGRAESAAETLARRLLLPALPRLEPQVELFDAAGRLVARFDLGDRDVRLAVEVDGKAAHARPAMVAKDRRRDERTQALGWHTERITWFELRRRQPDVVRRIAERHRQLLDAAQAA